MNLQLDELIRRFLREEQLRDDELAGPDADARLMPSASADIAAILSGDLRYLHYRGAHPLLIMQLAGALGIDSVSRLSEPKPIRRRPIQNGK